MELLYEVEELIESGSIDKAEAALAKLGGEAEHAAEAAYFQGQIHEARNETIEAINAYHKATEADPDHLEATFRLAFLLDLHGEDEEAMQLYEQCLKHPPLHVNALINLAVLYEDDGSYHEAERCLELILDRHPNHAKAQLLLKDVRSSLTMYYDEDQERMMESHHAIMDMPISEFELSVRSRNCLKQMDIHTLGDLMNVTEAQLMAYKNFGETSLNEIKALLTQKNLVLGQMLDDPSPEAPTALPTLGSDGIYGKSVNELELSVRSRKCIQRLGINTLGELAARSETELLSIKNFGLTSLNEIKRRMIDMGLSLQS